MKKKLKKIKDTNQSSFYFEDYLETNKKNKFDKKANIFQDRIYLLFFSFFCLIFIFSIKIIHISFDKADIFHQENAPSKFTLLRRDIVDRNGVLISRNIKSYDVAINPKFINDKNKFLIKLRLNFPGLEVEEIEKKLNKNKWFYLKRRIDQTEREKLWALGEKGIIFEPIQARMYTHGNLFSHIIGQVDYDNYGVSGIEKYFDRELKDKKLSAKPLKLTLDSNIQYLVNKELNEALITFNATGGGALLMDVESGDILSLVSLPNFDINKREKIKHINKITKGVYELGSVFKTFTVALALELNLVNPQTIIKNIPRKLKCSIHEISDIKEFPKNLSVEDILIRSSNIGTLLIARKIGEKNYKKFIEDSNLLKSPELQLEEVGNPINFNWNKCKLETISFGHGITTTPLQATSIYATLVNGGNLVKPNLIKNNKRKNYKRLLSKETSQSINNILRKVVTDKEGTASLADIDGYNVGGKTGTSQNYKDKNDNLNTFISIFPTQKPKYTLLVMLENPQVAKELIYNYRGMKIKGTRNEAGWNSVYVAGKIIKKIGPILAIKNEEFNNQNVAEKFN
jgi:cell division protein FtsI (penicillin-binding protein 3)